jgi:hypothetical protein
MLVNFVMIHTNFKKRKGRWAGYVRLFPDKKEKEKTKKKKKKKKHGGI